jgi:hypothetical protein
LFLFFFLAIMQLVTEMRADFMRLAERIYAA